MAFFCDYFKSKLLPFDQYTGRFVRSSSVVHLHGFDFHINPQRGFYTYSFQSVTSSIRLLLGP